MEENEGYESDVSDSTVLLTDYIDKPEKIESKRRRLSSIQTIHGFHIHQAPSMDGCLHNRGNRSGEEAENKAPDGVYENTLRASCLENKISSIDKNWHIYKYLACVSKNNDTNIQYNDSENQQYLDSNDKHGTNNSPTKQDDMFKDNTTYNDNNDLIICLDSEEETDIVDTSPERVKTTVEILSRNDCEQNPHSSNKPASISTRRATTDNVERNKIQSNRGFKPTVINLRRATIHFEESNLICNMIGNTTSESEKESKSDGCKILTLKSTSAGGKGTNDTSTAHSPLKMCIEQNNSMSNKDSRQDIRTVSDITAPKRFGGNNETQTEPKRIKIATNSTDPSLLSTNGLNIMVQDKMHITSAECRAVINNDRVESEKSNTNIANNICPTDEVNKQRQSVDAINTKLNLTANNLKSDRLLTNKDITRKYCDKETSDSQNAAVINKLLEQDNQVANKVVNECEMKCMPDNQGIVDLNDKQKTSQFQNIIRKPQDQSFQTKSESEFKTQDDHGTNQTKVGPILNRDHHKGNTNNTLNNDKGNETSDPQEKTNVQTQPTDELNDVAVINSVPDTNEKRQPLHNDKHNMTKILNKQVCNKNTSMTIMKQTNKMQETSEKDGQLGINNVLDEHNLNEPLDKESCKSGKIRDMKSSEIQGRQGTQKVNNENKTTEGTSTKEKDTENETPSKASCEDEDNDRILKFQLGFFVLLKEYLKEIFPESAMELQNLIQDLIVDTRNRVVQTDVKYSCPKCRCVSNYSSRIVDTKNKENESNPECIQKCGFCNGIRKLHNSYLKKYLDKKYRANDNKGVIKTVSTEKRHAIQVGQSETNSAREILISDSQTKCKANHDAVKKHLGGVVVEKPSKNISEFDINCSSNTSNEIWAVKKTALPVARTCNIIKAPVQNVLITKNNEICELSKSCHMEIEASKGTDSKTNMKRKSDGAHTETTDNKRVKSGTEENNTQVIQTNCSRNDKLSNEQMNKVQIIDVQTIPGTDKSKNVSGVGRAENSEASNNNTYKKSSKAKETGTGSEKLNAHKPVIIENTLNTEQVELDENNKEKGKTSDTVSGLARTDGADAKQVKNIKENDKHDEGASRALIDCFNKIKNNVKEKETTSKSQEGNKPSTPSVSKIRSNRSKSIDNLPNHDERKIITKYVCPICTIMYVYASKLLRHMQERHNPNLTTIPENCSRLQCPFCKILLSNKTYNKHVKMNHSDKFEQSVAIVENSTHENKCKTEKGASIKNKLFPNREDTENNNISETTKRRDYQDKNLATDCVTTQHKARRNSEQIQPSKSMDVGDIYNDVQDETRGGKNEEYDIVKDDNQGPSVESKEVAPDITRGKDNVNHFYRCGEETKKSSVLKLAARQNTRLNGEENAPAECINENPDTNADNAVSSLRNDIMHHAKVINHCEINSSARECLDTVPEKSSEELINNLTDDVEYSALQIRNDKANSCDKSRRSVDYSLSVSCITVENEKQQSDEVSNTCDSNFIQPTENIVMQSRPNYSYVNKEKESYSEDDCIKASDCTVKKRKERHTKLFGDVNEISVSSTINESNSNDDVRSEQIEKSLRKKERLIPKHSKTKTGGSKDNRKVRHRKCNRTEEQYSESGQSSDSDWVINNNESSDSFDEIFTPIPKQQVVRKLFSGENESPLQKRRGEEKSKGLIIKKGDNNQFTESGENNENSDEDSIKCSKYAIKKKKVHLTMLFGDDNDSDKADDREKNDTDRDCIGIDNNETAPSNRVNEVPNGDDTIKLSEHTVQKSNKEHISSRNADQDLTQSSESNQQMAASIVNNADCRVSNVDNNRTQVINEEDVVCPNVGSPEIDDSGTNDKNYAYEKGHQDISSKESATHYKRNTAVVGDQTVHVENKSRDDDRVEINMIDSLLKEFASDDQQNKAFAEEINDYDGDVRNSEINNESQATSESAIVQNCLDNIRITNVVSVKSKAHVFLCQDCNYATDVYDDAIRHCQNHYNLIEDQVTYCDICQIHYDTNCFDRHQNSHDKYLGNIKIKFSYLCLFTNWNFILEKHLSLNEAEEMQVKSIYKTFCIKMSVKEDGPWQSAVYLCAQCKACVPVLDIEKHVQQTCTFVKHQCRVCDRVFLTNELRKHHEVYHTDDQSKLFKTIVFNDRNDESFNLKLIQAKGQSKKQKTVDIFKCICGLCFISLKKFKLHFADCDSELNDGKECPMCTGITFLTTELEEHLALHHSVVKYEIRLQRITFVQESINDSSKRESPPVTLKDTYVTEITSNLEDLNIKKRILKDELLTQSTDVENSQKNLEKIQKETFSIDEINEHVPTTSIVVTDNATQVISIDEEFTIKRDMLKESLTQNSNDGGNNVEEHIRRDLTNENSPEASSVKNDAASQIPDNYEDLNIKREMLKEETLTESTNEEIIQEVPGNGENDINIDLKDGASQEIEHVVDTESSQEVMEVEQSPQPINIVDSQEIDQSELEDPITIEATQEMEVEGPDPDQLVTIEDSDDDVEFIGESFPNILRLLLLRH